MGVLYIVATPIGNLEDITLRALRVLKSVELIAAEDTRTTRKLLNRYDIRTSLTSYHEHNRAAKIPSLMQALETKDVAVVSEAGTPGISDPGYEMVLEAIKAGVTVIPIPGASAVISSLIVSGLVPGGFRFLGFLPRRKMERRRLLESLKNQGHTTLAFDAPHRLRNTLTDMMEVLGDRSVAVCRELTKLHEEIFRGTVSQALEHYTEPRGEFTLVIDGAKPTTAAWDLDSARDELRCLRGQGLKAREAVARTAQTSGLRRKDVYRLWLELGSEG